MSPGKKPRSSFGTAAVAALAGAAALALAPAAGAVSRPGDGDLSPRLAELAKPSVRSAPPAAQARALSLASAGAGSLLRDGNRVLAEVRFDHGAAAAVDDLRSAGAKIVDVSSRYQTVTVAVNPADLRELSGVPGIAAVTEVLAPITAAASTCPSGIAVSEGDQQLRAAEARTTFGVDGTGVTVGILSDSFDQDGSAETHQAEDVENGDLPGLSNTCPGQITPVAVLDDSETAGEDEGRAMAQIVHDLAPGANLSFATAFTGLTAFANNVRALASAGAKVIADDVSYFEEPFFQEGPVGVAVKEVTEGGVSYFSSAANNNLTKGGRDIASWEAPQYRDSSGCPVAVVALSEKLEGGGGSGLNPHHCMDFNPGSGVDRTFRITVSPGATLVLDLQWAEPWDGVGTDIDAFLLGPGGGVVTGSAEDNVFGTKRPFEFVAWENETGAPANVQLVINRFSGGTPRLKFALLQNGGGVTSTEYESSQGGDVVGPTIFGHNGAEDATSVGAIRYDATEAPEPYSSRGPVTHYFGPANGVIAAEPLASPNVMSKPDVTATDCGVTTFFASFVGVWRFCGTSAAAPHTAAVAALMLEEEPAATPEQIRLALEESATPIGSTGPCAVGAGLVDAVGALEALLSPGSGPGPACVTPESGPVLEEGDTEPPLIPVAPDTETPTAFSPATPGAPGSSDRLQPRTLFLRHPPRVIRTRHLRAKAVFRFGANESDVAFVCRVDGDPFRECPPRFVRRFEIGAHVLRVVARDAAGNADRSPAVFRFRVKQRG
jgi:hypothetical protein